MTAVLRHLRSRFSWQVATLWVLFAILLGFATDDIARPLLGDAVSATSSTSAIAILSAMASGMIAFTGFVFSIVVVILQFGSTAYSPRLVGWLGRHSPIIGHAMGIFVGTFMYALLAIRSVDFGGGTGVNAAVVGVAFAWLLASIVVFMILIPRARALSVAQILGVVGRAGTEAIDRTYPASSRSVEPQEHAVLPPASQLTKHGGLARCIRSLDVHALVGMAREAGGIVLIPHAVGDVVVPGAPLALILGGARTIPEGRLRSAIRLGEDRTVEQDPAFAVRILVDIAIRALSPAINDPTTAVQVLDQIEVLLLRLGSRHLEIGHVADEAGCLRLVYSRPTWEDYLSLALTEIQQYGRSSVQVQRRLGALLRDLEDALPPRRRGAVRGLVARREASLPDDFRPGGWIREGSASDRQGLGHTQS